MFETNWDDLEKIWHHAFSEKLNFDPTNTEVIFTESANTLTGINKIKMMEKY